MSAWSLAQTLDRLAPWTSAAQFPPSGLLAVRAVAGRIPARLTNAIYLERWLGHDSPRLDLIVRVDPRGRAVLADPAPGEFHESLRTQPHWQRLRAFARAWGVPGSALERHIDGLWIEFDVDPQAPHAAVLTPRAFIDFAREAQRWPDTAARLELAAQAVQALRGGPLDAPTSQHLRACLESLPAGATLAYLGTTLAEPHAPLRVCVVGLGARVASYLRAVGWPGDLDDLEARVLAPLAQTLGATHGVAILHLDLTPQVAPRIGLEYAFARAVQRRGRVNETAFLERLVERGWCSADDRDALLRWPGHTVELMAHEIWHSRVMRRLNHVKLTHATGEPVQLKAYLCFYFELLPGGTLIGTRPRFFERRAPESLGAPLVACAGAPSTGSPAPPRPAVVGDVSAQAAPRATPITARPHGTRLALSSRWRLVGGVFMLMSTTEQQALEAILERSSVDLEFRKRLLTDPRRAIHEGFGVRIPHNFRVKFIEKGHDVDALVVLPDIQRADGELSDGDLEAVAGGGGGEPPDPNWADGIG